MKFEFSHSCPELRRWFLVFPDPVQKTGKAFFSSQSRPQMQKVMPAHACTDSYVGGRKEINTIANILD